jgi:hypothetical protein
VSRLCPSISAVMPVPSETKNTVRLRLGMGGGGCVDGVRLGAGRVRI